ncbi:MAG: TniQ family protein, partial [Dissulfurispiraceae bacterium]
MTTMKGIEDYSLEGGEPEEPVPPRSVLASLKPMGLGSPYRESLSSYFLALAHLHHLTPKTLARELIIPLISAEEALRNGTTFTIWRMPLFNGIGAVPEAWATCLNDLTGRKDLVSLTMVPLRRYTNMQKLMSGTKKWCPLCLFEAARESRAYGHLLWEIDAVQVCPQHGIKLVSQCKCHGTTPLPTLNRKHLSGICGSCGGSLAHDSHKLLERASKKEIARAQLVADLLGNVEQLGNQMGRALVGTHIFLKDAVTYFARGNAALFGRYLGIKKNTLHGWIHGECIPTFPQTLNVAFICGCSMTDVMLGENVEFKKPFLATSHSVPSMPLPTRKTQKLNKKIIRRQLEMLAVESPPVGVAMAAT